MTPEMRALAERMRDDAAAEGDYRGAAELDALLNAEPTTAGEGERGEG